MLDTCTLNKRGMRTEGKLDPERYMLSAAEVEAITRLLKDEQHVQLVSPRLALSDWSAMPRQHHSSSRRG